jgi:WD40 repeat protein
VAGEDQKYHTTKKGNVTHLRLLKVLGDIRLVEVATGKERREWTDLMRPVLGAAFAPDGRTLATGGEDGVVLLRDVTGGPRRNDQSAARDRLGCFRLPGPSRAR